VNIRDFEAVDPGNAGVRHRACTGRWTWPTRRCYCSRLDTVAWDRVGLLPKLRGRYGERGGAVALAHEIGHAVQDRLGIDAGCPGTRARPVPDDPARGDGD